MSSGESGPKGIVLPGEIMSRVGFKYDPPEEPEQRLHRQRMEASRERFRQWVTVAVLFVTTLIACVAVGTCCWLAITSKEAEVRKNALTVLSGIVGIFIGALLGLTGGKALGSEPQKE